MMTVKAVVTFENFRSDGIDPSNFVVPAEYQRSRRMSKEKYIAGVVTGGGGGGGGEGGERGNSGAMDSDDEEEEGDFVDDVDEAELSEGELLRRRAAQRNAFDDDEVRWGLAGRPAGGRAGGPVGWVRRLWRWWGVLEGLGLVHLAVAATVLLLSLLLLWQTLGDICSSLVRWVYCSFVLFFWFFFVSHISSLFQNTRGSPWSHNWAHSSPTM